MKRNFLPFMMLLSSILLLASCLNSDDDFVYNDDAAITSFSVSGVKRYIHTTSSTGADSVYTKTMTCSSYKFYIDQVNCEIYNPDSLPCGVDARKVVCSISSSNSGTVLVQSMTSDSLAYFNSADSMDYTKPRIIKVYSNSGTAVRTYTVHVNVHQEQPDSMKWNRFGNTDVLRQFTDARAVVCGGRLFVFGTDGTTTQTVSTADGMSWRAATPNFNHTLAADAYQGVVVKNDCMYLSDGGNIMRSADADTWTVTGSDTGITRLVSASDWRLYGYAVDGRLMASADNGATWHAATIDADATLLPDADVSSLSLPSRTNTATARLLLIGKRGSDNVVWGKTEEGTAGSEDQPWAYYDVSAENSHTLPKLAGMRAFAYDKAAYVLGKNDTARVFYRSDDGGITWFADTALTVPNDIDLAAGNCAVAVDADNHVWLVDTRSGNVWKGRLNRLGWREEKKAYTE